MRVKVFLFAAITAVLTLPTLGKRTAFEKPTADPETEEVKGDSPARRAAYERNGFAPPLGPAPSWRKQWRADRKFERGWPSTRAYHAVPAKLRIAQRQRRQTDVAVVSARCFRRTGRLQNPGQCRRICWPRLRYLSTLRGSNGLSLTSC